MQYYDAQVDDARLHRSPRPDRGRATARTSPTRARVVGFLREGERVTGVRAADLETGRELEVRAQQVVNATGVWTDETQAMVGGRG